MKVLGALVLVVSLVLQAYVSHQLLAGMYTASKLLESATGELSALQTHIEALEGLLTHTPSRVAVPKCTPNICPLHPSN